LTQRYRAIAKTLEELPDKTVIDGEVVAFDESGHPSFNALQNFGSAHGEVYLYVFDLLVLGGRDIQSQSVDARRDLLEMRVNIQPGRPQQNGRHEWIHLTLKQQATRPAGSNILQQRGSSTSSSRNSITNGRTRSWA
jgi:ATP-dependent DNA ligase